MCFRISPFFSGLLLNFIILLSTHILIPITINDMGCFLPCLSPYLPTPPGSELATQDISEAYNRVPLHGSQWPTDAVQLTDDQFTVDIVICFGQNHWLVLTVVFNTQQWTLFAMLALVCSLPGWMTTFLCRFSECIQPEVAYGMADESFKMALWRSSMRIVKNSLTVRSHTHIPSQWTWFSIFL